MQQPDQLISKLILFTCKLLLVAFALHDLRAGSIESNTIAVATLCYVVTPIASYNSAASVSIYSNSVIVLKRDASACSNVAKLLPFTIWKMPIDFYYIAPSPPARAVLMTAKDLGIDMNLKVVNLLAGEHLKPEFLKVINLNQYFCLTLTSNTYLQH